MYRSLILDYTVYFVVAIIVIAILIKLIKLSSVNDHSNRINLFLRSFRYYSMPVLRNMVSKPGQEYLRFNNKLNAIAYIAIGVILLLYLLMKII